jgi:hypothetical protein
LFLFVDLRHGITDTLRASRRHSTFTLMNKSADHVNAMLVRIFRPLVRLLLRLGVPFQSCAEALKWTYVDIASNEFALDGKAQTKSRVAVITGLTRIEVERLQRETLDDAAESAKSYHRGARVITGWSNDTKYLSEMGEPMALTFDGPSPNFCDLVADYSGGTTPRAVLDDLQRSGAVARNANSLFEPTAADHLALAGDKDGRDLYALSLATGDLLSTAERNIRPHQDDRYVQLLAQETRIPRNKLPLVRQFARKSSQQWLDDTERFFASLAQGADKNADQADLAPRLGIGVFYFQDELALPPPPKDRRGRRAKGDRQ